MKMQLLTTISTLALLAASPAIAETVNTNTSAETKTTGDVSTDVNRAWEDIKDDSAAAYEDIKAVFIDEENTSGQFTDITINSRTTATGMIGRDVVNGNGDKVAKIEDIILNENGNAAMVVVADGGVLGLGAKLAAFDYNNISSRTENGDVIMPLTEQSIDQAAAFSYDEKDAGEKVRVMPANGYSVKKLLDADLVDPTNEKVAEVDNISFRGGEASQLIVAFDQVLGLGGKKAAMDFDDAKLVRADDNLDFQLNANQAAQFENYKKVATN